MTGRYTHRTVIFFVFFIAIAVDSVHAQSNWPKFPPEEWAAMDSTRLQGLLQSHSLDARDDARKTALMYAAQYATVAVVEYLVEQGADVNAVDELGIPALFWSVFNPNAAIVQLLIDAKASPFHRDNFGRQAHMFAAAYASSPEHLQILLRAGLRVSELDQWGRTALMYAVATNIDIRMTEVLLNYGANVFAMDFEANSIIFHAARSSKNPAIIQLLLDHRVQINKTDKDKRTPLHVAAALNPEVSVLQALIRQGASIDEVDLHGRTPLIMAAAFSTNADIVFALINAGANVLHANTAGKTAWNFLQRNEKLRNSESYAQLKSVLFR